MTTRVSPAFVRPLIGLVQGIALWGVHEMFLGTAIRDPQIRQAALAVALLVPPIALVGYGHMRTKSLTAWVVAGTAFVAGIAAYDEWRNSDAAAVVGVRSDGNIALLFFMAATLYVVHHLLEPADEARRWRPPYAAYVDGSWRHAFQLALSLLFIGVLSGILYLAAALFRAIGLERLPEMLVSPGLQFPLLGLAFGIAMARTDVRPALIDGVRKVVLLLFAWLLPVVVGFGTLFIALLPFTGLAPLWATRHATTLLLCATALLVVLVNAAYQDGRDPATVAPLVRWSGRIGGIVLPVLVVLASWALWLRVAQYGFSPERVTGLATCAFAATYAIGYALAATRRGAWMHAIEHVNVVAALVGVVLMVSLSSPIADPARLSTTEQMRRLASGRAPAAQFDFSALRFRLARFGRAALATLERSADAEIASRVRIVQTQLHYQAPDKPVSRAFANAHVRPDGAVLPTGFREQVWSEPTFEYGPAACLVSDRPCDLFVVDLDGDGRDDVLVLVRGTYWQPMAFLRNPDGSWRHAGNYLGPQLSIAPNDDVALVPPLPTFDLRIGDKRLRFVPTEDVTRPRRTPLEEPAKR